MVEFAWHVHHCGVIVEALVEPIEKRIEYIKAEKDRDEVSVRLRLLKKVHGELPKAVVEAGQSYVDAYVAAERAFAICVSSGGKCTCGPAGLVASAARENYEDTLAAHRTEVEALHAIECPDCPWDGETIFPVTVT